MSETNQICDQSLQAFWSRDLQLWALPFVYSIGYIVFTIENIFIVYEPVFYLRFFSQVISAEYDNTTVKSYDFET